VQGAVEVLKQVLPVYLLLVAGAALRRGGVTRREHDEGVLHLVFHVMYPCFILDKILGSESVRDPGAVVWGIGVGMLFALVGFGMAWLGASLLGYERGNGKRTFTVATGVQNFGYTAIPVVEQMWLGSGAIAMLFVHNFGVEIAIWSAGVMILSGERGIPWRRLVNGPMVVIVVGLGLVALGWDRHITGPPREAMRWMGAGSFPVAVFITGAIIMDLIGRERPSWRASLGAPVLRLALIPAMMLVAARWLPMPLALKQVLLVQAAMPSAMTPILLAKLYGGRPSVAVEVVVATTVVSLLSMPLVLILGRDWLGL